MSTEYLSFNKGGQWTLCKASPQSQPHSDYRQGTEKHKVFGGKAKDGMLHEDHGTKGSLRNFGGGVSPKRGRINWENVGKPAHAMESVYNERNPGVGD